MDYVGQLLVFLGALVAVRGDTWQGTERRWRKVTLTGWLTVGLALAGLMTAMWQTAESSREAEVAKTNLLQAKESAEAARVTITQLESKIITYQDVLGEIKHHSERQMQMVMTQAVHLEPGRTWRAPNHVFGGSAVEIFFMSGEAVELRYGDQRQRVVPRRGSPTRVFIMGHSGQELPWKITNVGSRPFGGKIMVYSTPRSRSADWSWLEEKLESLPKRSEVAARH